ncbi:MAG: CHRD domain-containing protein [Pseudomonadota bacterium]
MAYDSPNTRSKLIGSAASLAAFLMFAGRAQAQSYADDSSSLVDIAGLDGVASVTQQGDGSVLVTLDTGETLTLSAGDVVIENGVVFADPSVIADAGAAAGLSINPYLIGAAAVGVGVIAAVASSDDDDGAGANNNIVLNAPPVFTSGTEASVEENTLETGFTATAQDTNGDALTFSISGGADAALFAIDANTGALSFAQAPDFEVPGDADGNNDFVVEISVTDGEFTATQTVTVTVTNINDNAPVIVSGNAVTVTENGTDAYQAEANDADGDAITFSLSGDDAALFAIDAATGLVTFIAAPDFEAPADANGDNAYQITVTASDGTNTVSQAVTITVADQLEVIGTDGNDALTGSDDADIIDAGAGDDVIDSLQGSDQISTGTGRDILNFAGDPFEGADVSAEGRQIVGGEDFISDFDFANDSYRFDAEDFGVGGEVRFASLDANADGAAIPAGSNVIVLLNADNDGDASTPFLAGTAAAQIAALVDDAGPGFFVYWNSNLGVNRLVYSTDLSDPSADLKIVSRQTDLSGQDAIDALADFNAENFEFVSSTVVGSEAGETVLGTDEADEIFAGAGDDRIEGAGGSDTITTGTGQDAVVFAGDPFDGADVSAEGRQIVGNEDFIEDFEFGTPTTTIEVVRASTTADVVFEAEAGNIYFNIHSTNFPAGEVRGQLELSEDNRDEAGFGSVTFTAVLNGENEVQDPPVVTEAEGTGTVTFFIAPDGTVTYETLIEINAFDDDTLTVGHFHNAPAGANGPVVVDILADARADLGSIEGGTYDVGTLAIDVTDAATTAEVLSEAEAGNIYYNIHSSNFPAGEVRGQLELVSDERDAAGYGDVTFSAILNGENEVQDPAVVTNADGDATITFTVANDGSVTYTTDIDIESFDPDTLTVGHLHNAPAGENGPVVQDILADARETTGEIAGSTVDVPALDIVVNTAATTSDVLSEAEAGNIYYNIHSSNFPAGEVRGQLVLVSDERDAAGNGDVTFTAILNGENEVQDPAVVTNADGVGNITFTVANGSVSYTTAVNIENFDIGTLTVGHLHNAPAGANGPVVQDILADAAADGSVTGSTIEQPQLDITVAETSVESSVLAEAEAGNIYFNIHSSDFPAGEVRGQLALTEDARDANGYGTATFSAVLNGAQEVQDPAVDTFADGTGTVVFTVANDGSVTYEASVNVTDFDVARLTVGHLHNAPAGENGPVVVDLLADANATQGSIEGGEATIPTLDIAVDFAETDASVVSEAEAGNIYFNIHSSNFPAGEVRGQLELESDARDASGYGTVTFTAILNGLQEVQDPPVDTDAEGVGTVTFDIAPDGTVTYSATVDIENFDVSTLTVGHLHNAPAGENGPVVVDLLADAQAPAGSIDGANEGGDVYSLNAADFGVEGDVSFLALDANADGASIAAGTNVIVLLNSDNDANPDTPFLAGTAAAQIAELTEADGAGFFIYWNSNLGVNRLVYSTNLNDASADLKIVARQTDLEGQEAIDALSSFSAENFVFEGGSEAATASLTETEEADLTQMISDLEPVDFAAEIPVELGLLSTLPSESGEVDAPAGTPVGAFVGVDIDLDVDDADAAAVASQTLNGADGW